MQTAILNSHYGWYDIIDPAGSALETPPVEGTSPPPVGGANGLVGKTYPWRGMVATGTREGPVQVTIEVLTEQPHDLEVGYGEIVEVDFTVLSDQLTIVDWGGRLVQEFSVTPGSWRLRVHARGRHEGAAQEWDIFDPDDTDGTEYVEEHLLQFFPGPESGETVIQAAPEGRYFQCYRPPSCVRFVRARSRLPPTRGAGAAPAEETERVGSRPWRWPGSGGRPTGGGSST